jgi:hypothetical protein
LVWLNLGWVVWWSRHWERRVLLEGRPLSEWERDLARKAGVLEPSVLRVLVVSTIPMPGPRFLRRLAARLGFDAATTLGLCLGRGILLRSEVAGNPRLLIHECAHSAQYERLGGHARFLCRYLTECLELGYESSPLELEAAEAASRVWEQARRKDPGV